MPREPTEQELRAQGLLPHDEVAGRLGYAGQHGLRQLIERNIEEFEVSGGKLTSACKFPSRGPAATVYWLNAKHVQVATRLSKTSKAESFKEQVFDVAASAAAQPQQQLPNEQISAILAASSRTESLLTQLLATMVEQHRELVGHLVGGKLDSVQRDVTKSPERGPDRAVGQKPKCRRWGRARSELVIIQGRKMERIRALARSHFHRSQSVHPESELPRRC